MPLILSSNSKTPLAVTGAASVTLEALRGLSPDTLASEITRVQNSVAHLRRSNDEMEALASGMGEESEGLDESDRRELKVACEENDGVV